MTGISGALSDGAWWPVEASSSEAATADDGSIIARGWSDDPDQAARLDLPYWDGSGYHVFRDGAWHEYADQEATSDEAEPLADALDSGTDEPEQQEADVTTLTWVTSEQRALLDELDEIRGSWDEWLPGELDARAPGWKTADPSEVSVQLDAIIPILLLPEPDEAVSAAQQIVQELNAPGSGQMLEFAASLSEEQLEQAMTQAAALRA